MIYRSQPNVIVTQTSHRPNVMVDETSYRRNDFRQNVMEAPPSRSPDIVLRESKLWPVFIVCAKRSTTYDMTSPFTNYTKHRLLVLVKTAYMRQFQREPKTCVSAKIKKKKKKKKKHVFFSSE